VANPIRAAVRRSIGDKEKGEKSEYADWFHVREWPLTDKDGIPTFESFAFTEAMPKLNTENPKVKEIPYTFTDRKVGSSKLDSKVILDFVKALLHLYAFKNSKSFRDKPKRQKTLIGRLRSFPKIGIPMRL
jgi:hypothetical protein